MNEKKRREIKAAYAVRMVEIEDAVTELLREAVELGRTEVRRAYPRLEQEEVENTANRMAIKLLAAVCMNMKEEQIKEKGELIDLYFRDGEEVAM